MAYELAISRRWRSQGWRVKIRDKERLEPPHVTIIRRTDAWRINLRTGSFMDRLPDPSDVPQGLLDQVFDGWDELVEAWDAMYPDNPVQPEDDDDE